MGYIPLNQEPKSTFLKLLVIVTRQVTNSSSKVLGGQTFGTWCSLAIQSKVIVMETTYTKKHKILLWEHCVQPCSTKGRAGSAPWGNLLAQWGWGGVQARYCTSYFHLFTYRQDSCSTHPFPEHSLGPCLGQGAAFCTNVHEELVFSNDQAHPYPGQALGVGDMHHSKGRGVGPGGQSQAGVRFLGGSASCPHLLSTSDE